MKRSLLFLLLVVGLCAWAQESQPTSKSEGKAKSSAKASAKAGGNAAAEDAIKKMERELWDAWKNKDTKPFTAMLAEDAKSIDAMMGVVDKPTMLKSMAEQPCEVKSYSFSDDKVSWIAKDTAVYTYTASVDATCGGQKVPDKVYAGSVWAKRGTKWVGVFHQETPAMPMPPAKPTQ
jgi:ketosteroid isomerase-like protein